jgi:hypothetical protein
VCVGRVADSENKGLVLPVFTKLDMDFQTPKRETLAGFLLASLATPNNGVIGGAAPRNPVFFGSREHRGKSKGAGSTGGAGAEAGAELVGRERGARTEALTPPCWWHVFDTPWPLNDPASSRTVNI